MFDRIHVQKIPYTVSVFNVYCTALYCPGYESAWLCTLPMYKNIEHMQLSKQS